MLKPLKERLIIYSTIIVSLFSLTVGMLFIGYDYSKARGFFNAEDREAMGIIELFTNLPNEIVWSLLFLFSIVTIIEILIFLFQKK